MAETYNVAQLVGHERRQAYDSLSHHAALSGNASSQALLAFFLATGYADVIPIDQAQVLLYYTFAALGGHKCAQMALGYRYEAAADEVTSMFLSSPPGGQTLPQTATRLSGLDGGMFGPGASVASTSMDIIKPAVKAGLAQTAGETWDDVLEYYIFNADRGETGFKLGKIYYQGSIYSDFHQSQLYFLQIARQVWPRDPMNPLQHTAPGYKAENIKQAGFAPKSVAYLGWMYLRDGGVKQDYAMAMIWFERGVEFEDRDCHNILGVMWRDGLVPGRRDVGTALVHISKAAGLELAEAHGNLGKYNYYRSEFKLTIAYFEAVVGTERGKEIAILKWWVAAEKGSEMAQNNLAYVLDQDQSMLCLTQIAPIEASNDTALLALTQWTCSAAQQNTDSLIKVGDYYYHGLGVPDEPEALRWEKVAKYYQSAYLWIFDWLACASTAGC
ncbi:hypothetical protein EDB19DRAFT_1996365 [Suillus lakei]|nr:hypothetical protein EDB19DRAFT_1996365 [Suillus lakei]